MNIRDLAQTINEDVNRFDYEPEHVEDWSPISEAGKGDCDSYATEKFKRLAAAGVPDGQLGIATAWMPDGQYHAVALVRDGDRLLVLDNANDRVVDYRQAPYKWNYIPDYLTEGLNP